MIFDKKHEEIGHNLSINGTKVIQVNVAKFVGVY